jgi:hypothetical protein
MKIEIAVSKLPPTVPTAEGQALPLMPFLLQLSATVVAVGCQDTL